jgi:hypothetical protein
MPHIHAILEEKEKIVRALIECKSRIREALSEQFSKYQMRDIALIPRLVTFKEMAMADNLLPLELVIDLGKLDKLLDDSDSDAFRDRLLEFCPELRDINFGIWLREMSSNGFSEHNPSGNN